MEQENTKKPDYGVNQMVMIILAVVTLGEFLLGVIAKSNLSSIFIGMGVVKAWFIVVNYMNIGRLFQDDEESH